MQQDEINIMNGKSTVSRKQYSQSLRAAHILWFRRLCAVLDLMLLYLLADSEYEPGVSRVLYDA